MKEGFHRMSERESNTNLNLDSSTDLVGATLESGTKLLLSTKGSSTGIPCNSKGK